MRLSRLTPVGLIRFSEFLDSVRETGVGSLPEHVLTEPDFSRPVADVLVGPAVFTDRLSAANYLDDLFGAAKLADVDRDAGLWAWLAARHFDALCARTPAGHLRPGERARWILEPTNFQRYYRHLLAGPYFIYRAHRDDPGRAASLLCGAVNAPGEVSEQLASSIEFITNRALVELATKLYFDPSTGRLKRGAGGKGPGSPRRLVSVVNQFDLTWDLYGMNADDFMALLPQEFARFGATPGASQARAGAQAAAG